MKNVLRTPGLWVAGALVLLLVRLALPGFTGLGWSLFLLLGLLLSLLRRPINWSGPEDLMLTATGLAAGLMLLCSDSKTLIIVNSVVLLFAAVYRLAGHPLRLLDGMKVGGLVGLILLVPLFLIPGIIVIPGVILVPLFLWLRQSSLHRWLVYGLLVPAVILIPFVGLLIHADAQWEQSVQGFATLLQGFPTQPLPFAFSIGLIQAAMLTLLLRGADALGDSTGVEPTAVQADDTASVGVVTWPESELASEEPLPQGLLIGQWALSLLLYIFLVCQLGHISEWLGIDRSHAAEWARQGFLEMLLVVALAIPVNLFTGLFNIPRLQQAAHSFRVGVALISWALGFFIVCALFKLGVYITLFHALTIARLNGAYFGIFLALAVVIFFRHCQRVRVEDGFIGLYFKRLAWPCLSVLLLMNVAGVDSLVARVNIAQGVGTEDFAYGNLSADAVPAILEQRTTPALSTPQGIMVQAWRNRPVAEWNMSYLIADNRIKAWKATAPSVPPVRVAPEKDPLVDDLTHPKRARSSRTRRRHVQSEF